MVGSFWRKQWLWAKVVLGGAARMWVYLNSPDLNFLSVKWVVWYLHQRTEWNDALTSLAQSPLGPWAGSHPPW